MRRLALILGALLATVALVFTLATPASAFDDFGISNQGFNRWQYDACATHGALHFQYDAYRYNSDTVTFQFWVGDPGHMRIQAVTPGSVVHDWAVYQLGLGRVWYAHITARLSYIWTFDWWPDSGGSCHAELRV